MEIIKCLKDGVIGKIHVSLGDTVEKGQELLAMETKKGNLAVKSLYDGKVAEIYIEEGNDVATGDVLFEIDIEQEVNYQEESSESEIDDQKSEDDAKIINEVTTSEQFEAEIVIIGGGPGGYVAALRASQLGAKVIVIEKEKLGGTCLNVGCIPTKTFVRSAEMYSQILESSEFGIFIEDVSIDMERIVDRKNQVVNKLVSGIDYLFEKKNIQLIQGDASLVDDKTVLVERENHQITISGKNIIIATGSEPSNLNIEGTDLDSVLTSRQILDMSELPDELVVIGGGVIGMEFAFIYATLGVKVTVIEYFDQVLNALDDDVIEEINKEANKLGIKLYTSSKVIKLQEAENDKTIITFEQDQVIKVISTDKVLMAVGRKPRTSGLKIDELNMDLEKNMGIKVDHRMKTNIQGIYAIGDVTGGIQLAHVASHQGIVAVENIMGLDKDYDGSVIPSAIFTSPEIATVGISEKEAVSKGMNVKVGKFPMAANGKVLTMGDDRGFVKVISDNNGLLIGATVVGLHASDLIATLTVAIKNKISVEAISETIFAHPTTAEVIHEGALSVLEGALHYE